MTSDTTLVLHKTLKNMDIWQPVSRALHLLKIWEFSHKITNLVEYQRANLTKYYKKTKTAGDRKDFSTRLNPMTKYSITGSDYTSYLADWKVKLFQK